tara:strand:- start:1987 stop:2661 length:675 start_codon:yes stop_codon:yes gene_type:complete
MEEFDSELEISKKIHQAILDPHITSEKMKEICQASMYYKFECIATHVSFIRKVSEFLDKNTKIKIIGLISFPFGASPCNHKKSEAEIAAEYGAKELDIVPNLFSLKARDFNDFGEEISEICSVGLPTRVILNTHRLSLEETKTAINLSLEAGAIGIQNSNGLGTKINIKDIKILSKIASGKCEIKAVGGIRSLELVCSLIHSGASKIGTSFGPEIMSSVNKDKS